MAIIRIARLWPGAGRAAEAAAPAIAPMDVVKPAAIDPQIDSLDSFGSETPTLTLVPPPGASSPVADADEGLSSGATHWTTVLRVVALAGVAAAAIAAAGFGYWQRSATATGLLTIQTTPAGLDVAINGRSSGRTPLTVALAPATYAIKVGQGVQERDLTVQVAAGSTTLQHLELPAVAEAAAPIASGALLVQTEPSGQAVAIDGVERGTSPLTVAALDVGEHAVTIRGARGTVRRTIAIKAGETVSLVVAAGAPASPAPGWLSVRSATRLELRENGRLLGSSETDQLMLTAGVHDIELVSDAVGYRARRQIEVRPGETTVVPVELPYGSLNINAQPWAEVWIDGERIGETPIANVSRRAGTYEVLFKHPELGERRESITVTLRQPTRLGIDLRSKQ